MNPAPETEGWILVQPETVARTLDHLDDLIDELRGQAEALANRDSGEWLARGSLEHAQASQRLLVGCVEHGNVAAAQGLIGMVEEIVA
jgi:hypothetical protein